MNLYLIGYRATGKTTVGAMLAQKLSFTFLDMDDELSLRFGRTISEVVAGEGWEYFRRAEKHMLAGISKTPECVVATGGGVVLDSDNVWRMRESGKLIWLKADPDTLAMRLADDGRTGTHRPSLTGKTASEEVAEALAGRLPLYKAAADFAVDTQDRSPEAVCDQIIHRLMGLMKDPA